MDRFLLEAAFESEGGAALIWEPALLTENAVRLRMLSLVSKNQNKRLKCLI